MWILAEQLFPRRRFPFLDPIGGVYETSGLTVVYVALYLFRSAILFVANYTPNNIQVNAKYILVINSMITSMGYWLYELEDDSGACLER